MSSTKRMEFAKFHKKLMERAPENYTPWYFPVVKEGKAPDVKISWKSEPARIDRVKADERLSQGLNVGISGRKNDNLILVDIDDPSIESELKPTLKIRSRSRIGTHAIYWADPKDKILPTNIPTEKGEIRSSDQYVVAPGSYVPCTKEELTKKVEEGEITEEDKEQVLNDPDCGRYTLDNDKDIRKIKFKELPEVFRNTYRKSKQKTEEIKERRKQQKKKTIDSNNDHSALFDLTIEDVAPITQDKREPHPIHNSETGMNWSISNGLGHCWRHLVSLNAIQYLCVDCNYLSCQEAGSPHHNSNAGPSEVIDNDEAIWRAWIYAKKQGYIPKDDKAPIKAIKYVIKNQGWTDDKGKIPKDKYDRIPPNYWNAALDYIKEVNA